jgi:hypothetical protein
MKILDFVGVAFLCVMFGCLSVVCVLGTAYLAQCIWKLLLQ